MFCAISGSVPEQPVVSTKSGHVFERRLVEKYVRETGKCPITGEALALEELLPLKASKAAKPRTAPATSIPGLLGLFHDEWDALMLETHTLRQQLHTVRQELCHALYQHDAATRVIARLMRERDEARAALEQAREAILAEQAAGSSGKRGAAEGAAAEAAKRQKTPSIPEEVLQELQDVNQQLSKQRKKREISKTLATPEELASLALLSSTPLHKTTQPGITALALSPDASRSVVATAGADATVQLFDYAEQRIAATLEGHSKRVTGVQFVSPGVLLTSSADKTARVWRADAAGAAFACAATLRDHTAEVVGVTLHPSRKYFVTGSADATWCFYDLEAAALLRTVAADEAAGGAGAGKDGYTTLQFHPDGLILGTGEPASRGGAGDRRRSQPSSRAFRRGREQLGSVNSAPGCARMRSPQRPPP